MTDRFVARAGLLILAGTLVVAFWRMLLLGEVLFWGLPALQFVPWRDFAFETLRSGHLPLWNPYNGAGAPLLANYQTALLYPFTWPGLILPLAWTMSLTAALHLFIGGAGMWVFTGRLEAPALGRGLAALAFGLTSYLVARLGTFPTVTTAAWLPWLLWAAAGVINRGQRRDLAWLALFTALLLLAGHAQTAWYSLLLTGAFAGWLALTRRPVEWRRLLALMAGLALGALVSAAQLIPTAELLMQSQRSDGVDFDFAMNYSYGSARFLNLLSPNVFGTPGDGSYVTEGAFFEDAAYVGLIPLVSGLAAVISWAYGRLRRRERPACFATVPFWLLVLVIGYVFALGDNTPIFPFLYHHIPTFDLFQAPVRWHLWTVCSLSVLAAVGVGVWGRGYWLLFGTRLATAGCAGAVLLAWLAAPRLLPPEVYAEAGVRVIVRAVIYTGLVGVAAGLLTLAQPEAAARSRYRLWALLVLLVVAADLGYAARGLNPTVDAAFYQRREPPAMQRGYWPKDAEEMAKFEKYLPFEDYGAAVRSLEDFRTSLLPDLNLLDRVDLLNSFDPLLVGHEASYLNLIESSPAQRDQLLLAAGVDTVIYAENEMSPAELTPAAAWFVESACWHADDTALRAALLDAAWQPLRQAHLVGLGDCPALSSEMDVPGVVLSLTTEPNRITVTVQTPTGGLLVVPKTDYPGWTAAADDMTVTLRRVNSVFTGVEIPAGTQTVVLEYRPGWLLPGALVSLVGLVVLVVLFRSKNPDSEPRQVV
jgi:hypothetical protein